MPSDPPSKPARRSGGKRPPAPAGPEKPRRKQAEAAGDAPRKPRAQRKPRQPKAPPRRAGSWRRTLVFEALTVLLGLGLGLAIAGAFLWARATRDVDAWLADPPHSAPGVVWSAPLRLAPGHPAPRLAEDLLAAGYERVPELAADDQFTVAGGEFAIRTAAGPWGPGTRVALRVGPDGGVVEMDPPRPVALRPVPLAVIGDLDAHRTPVALADLSPWIEPAVLAMEDARFRAHSGVDPLGILRAVVRNLSAGGPLQGGSTLTQQLAKNLFLSQERTARRKVREAFFAAALERRLSKDALLELYLGEVYLGQHGGVPIHGVEQAARAFFGLSASHLDPGQAATIAGIISSPNAYSPLRHPERATERRDLALERMVTTGALTRAEADAAKARPLVIGGVVPAASRRAPFVVDAALDDLEQALGGGIAAGYQVHALVDPGWQALAEQAVREGLAEVAADHPEAAGAQAALVAVRVSDGAVVAMVGSADYAASPFNRATQAWRQIGSTVKPLTLLAAFDRDPTLTPLTRLDDAPLTRRIDGRPWTPSNYDGAFVGEITVRRAIETSRNIPAILLAEAVGPMTLQEHLRTAGLSRATHLPSAALGAFPGTAIELAGAYTAFPGGGSASRPRVVARVEGPDGAPLFELAPERVPVSGAISAALATRVLEGVITHGTGARAQRYGVSGPVGGKTGTTDDYRDAWFAGFTPELAVVVWVGNDRGEGAGLSGGQAAIPIWARFVAHSGAMGGALPRPDGVVAEDVCVDSARPARPACPNVYTEHFRVGTVPEGRCDEHGGPLVEVGGSLQRLLDGLLRRRRDRDGAE